MPTHTSGQANLSFNSRECGTAPTRGPHPGSESAWGRDQVPEPGVLKETHDVTALALCRIPECPGFPSRFSLDPDMEVEVEILDVTEEEARVLLLSIDPLAALAQSQEQIHQRLLELVPPVLEEVQAAWRAAAQASLAGADEASGPESVEGLDQYLVLIKCRDEKQQVDLLRRLHGEGLECKALLS